MAESLAESQGTWGVSGNGMCHVSRAWQIGLWRWPEARVAEPLYWSEPLGCKKQKIQSQEV